MKRVCFVLCILFSVFSYSQILDTKAEFPGGENAFKNEFMKMVHSYVDTSIYAVNGKFTFVIEINGSGIMTSLKIYPRVRNYEEFIQDMEFAMKKIKKRWKPATKQGKPVSSNYIFEINFTTDYADHGD